MNRWLWIGIALVALVIALALRVEDANAPGVEPGPGGSGGAVPTRILAGSAAAADWVAALVTPRRVVALPAAILAGR